MNEVHFFMSPKCIEIYVIARQEAWRSLLREYDGRYADCAFSISFSADYSNPKGKSTTDYNIRYTFTGAKINGKKAILEIPLKCDDNTDHVAAVNKKLFKQPVLKASNW